MRRSYSIVLQIGILGTIGIMLFIWKSDYDHKHNHQVERQIRASFPKDIHKACEEYKEQKLSFIWPADWYGNLNLFFTKGHHVFYHTRRRALDEDPCHHLEPDKTQIKILPSDMSSCDKSQLESLIRTNMLHHHDSIPFIVTFCLENDAKYEDMITAFDDLEYLHVPVYCIRSITSTEETALISHGAH